ncbi:MAG TPA: hypothetical protein PK331_04715 [Gordonia sp. (in: high G+C Gram-positive bacteria)]|uniref:T3SS (YopN, CesT) and YbjN peptide-binding chaperone 1 n=1 Tax=unclassified Gordonia (in: high G+C Gram-positive bacteria) TaxID=2657482 RepID=UPI000F98434B|nr:MULTISPECIES: hypothetical protein [unclassified Gordonia (in: high G+C Gram-positive bacteria)]RUP37403.1 MAG: hypothetical protein EKK60_12610 [Gordonia sp. (in: high G+C Gram-positive bacteria)]HNP56464.1 hypothetical protein [Gordonia sp. (in: high G+C Gram-positive bacteria)]HRC50217.1 hypothetical protein [Gordonia sp. (in: high G+C Gram-positive bacteria)]
MANVDAVKNKIQQILVGNLNNVTLTKQGGFSVRNGSARVFVDVSEWRETHTLVKIEIPVLFDVRRSPELYERIAFLAGQYVFGTIYLRAVEDPTMVMVALEHNLLGDYLDEAELVETVLLLANVADDVDDELKAEFGGERFHEEG